MIYTEARRQQRYLEALVAHLDALLERVRAAPGRLAVLDTNVVLHHEPADQVDWPTVVAAAEARLVVPLRVVEELDEKKYTARSQLAERARSFLSCLWQVCEPTAGGPARLRLGATIEVPLEEGSRDRPLDADEEILATCSDLRSAGADVVLITGDTGFPCAPEHVPSMLSACPRNTCGEEELDMRQLHSGPSRL